MESGDGEGGRALTGLTLLFGGLVGFSLGLTGGGGAIFAVPLLVYGLGVGAHEAVGVSLATVGGTSLVGALGRLRSGEIEIGTGLLFAISGMVGAPVGAWVGRQIPEALLLGLFAVVMLLVAARMWVIAGRGAAEQGARGDVACARSGDGKLRWSSRCAGTLVVLGVLTGVLSGMFGVGGGFVVVPALVLFTAMSMHRAVGTSLLVISLVSASGVAAHVVGAGGGGGLRLEVVWPFMGGGILGLGLGTLLSGRLSGPRLQKIFAGAMVAVAVFIVVKSFL